MTKQNSSFLAIIIIALAVILLPSKTFASTETLLDPNPKSAQAGIFLGHNPKHGKMTKIAYRHYIADNKGTLNELGAFKLYLYADKYLRLECPKSPLLNPAKHLMIVNVPESWYINANSKEGYYTIQDEHVNDFHWKIFPEAGDAEDYTEFYFGREFKYFLSNKPTTSNDDVNGIDSSRYVINNGDIGLMLIVQKPKSLAKTEGMTSEIQITYKGQIIHKYLVDEYAIGLPVDMKLFSIPSGVEKIHKDEQSIKNYEEQKYREKQLLESSDKTKEYADPKHRWILACSGVLWERNRNDYITIAGEPVSEKTLIARKKMLAEWWDIKSKNDFHNTLIWLTQEGGHRSGFENIGKKASEMSEADYTKWIDKYSDDLEKQQEIRIARKYYNELGDKSILGWDYCRYICLCRWGYSCGYIDEKEAWNLMTSVAKEIQKKFRSWQEYGQNYLIGRQFWSHQYTLSQGDLFMDALKRLTENADSPWNTLPWDQNLSE